MRYLLCSPTGVQQSTHEVCGCSLLEAVMHEGGIYIVVQKRLKLNLILAGAHTQHFQSFSEIAAYPTIYCIQKVDLVDLYVPTESI